MKQLLFLLVLAASLTAKAQDDDIWRSVDLGNVDFKKSRNYCVRLYAYYRYTDDGIMYINDREMQLYRVNEGICAIDVRYKKDEDDGAEVIAGRNLVHPNWPGEYVDYYELKPYTFLEKARRDPKRFTIRTCGDTTCVYTSCGLAGTAVRDTARHELRMQYNALSPDTAYHINLLIVRGHMSNVQAEAVYHADDNEVEYVPQGQLKRMTFEGDIDISMKTFGMQQHDIFHERTELYVDSVVYMTRDEYRADKKLTRRQRNEQSGYTDADIERLKHKHGVPPLSAEQRQRIEDQRDWDEKFAQWLQNNAHTRAVGKVAERLIQNLQ